MKKVEVKVQRTYSREVTTLVDVPSNLRGNSIREYLIDTYDGSSDVDAIFNLVPLVVDETVLQDVDEVEQEFKIKWEIELTASTKEEAAKLALEMIQSSDSTAKVFSVGGEMIDLCPEDDEDVAIISHTFERVDEKNVPVYNQVPDAVMRQLNQGGNSIQSNLFKLIVNGFVNIHNDFIEITLDGYTVIIYIDKGIWEMEIVEDSEVTRGKFMNAYYIIDKD
jgi:hypothetical protein